MLSLIIQANTFAELKQKAFEELGITAPAQSELPFIKTAPETDDQIGYVDSPIAAMAEASKPRRTRSAPKAKEETSVAPKEVEVSAPSIAEPVNPMDHDTAKGLLAQVIAKHGMDKAISIIKSYGVKMVPQLKPEQLRPFADECEAALA